MDRVKVNEGDSCIILSQPHGGTYIPDEVAVKLNDRGKTLKDTDWHIHQLYDDLLDSATIVEATFHRYVIDANRSPNNTNLYPGINSTSLCPTTDFDGKALYLPQSAPDSAQIKQRLTQYHIPYHFQLKQQIDRIKQRHGFVIVFDCHSIRSHIPFLFEGTLPDINIGTFDEKSCDISIQNIVSTSFAATCDYSYAINGRFKGGWTTRHYGQPKSGVHVIQLELAQQTYMSEKMPWAYHNEKANHLRNYLGKCLGDLSQLSL